MSASSKKKLRKEQEAAALTEKQLAEQKEAKKLKLYTAAFVIVLVALLVVAVVFGVSNDMTGYCVPPNDFVLNKTQPYLNTARDRFDRRHYHETNSMGPNTQRVIKETFEDILSRV